MNDTEKLTEDILRCIDYFAGTLDDQPIEIKIGVIQSMIELRNKLNKLYIMALMNDKSKEQSDE